MKTSPSANLSVGLVHWPILDKSGKIVATNVTNLDVHDIARACRVYDVPRYFVIHPMKEQLMFVSRLLDFWRVGGGSRYNPMRKTALTPVLTAESIEKVRSVLPASTRVVATSARQGLEAPAPITFQELKESLEAQPTLLLFGTGFGLSPDALAACDFVLEPIRGVGPSDYRHLSVRSAVSICLDRLLGTW